MPEYTIRDPKTGRTLVVEGDHQPTDAERDEIFKAVPAEQKSTEATTPQASAASRFWKNLEPQINPVKIVSGLYQSIKSPEAVGKTIGNVMSAHGDLFQKAYDAYQQGDYDNAVGYATAGSIPFFGPPLAAAREQIASGDWAGGAGALTGLATSIVAPKALIPAKRLVTATILPKINPMSPGAQLAEFGLREKIPVDVATATGNAYARAAKNVSERSLAGSFIGGNARTAADEALTATGERLAGRTAPISQTIGEAADRAVGAVETRAKSWDAKADAAYAKVRAEEARQQAVIDQYGGIQAPPTSKMAFTKVPLAVDTSAAKPIFRPIYEALAEENAQVAFAPESGKAKAFLALGKLMKAPDLTPLSIADSALSELKALARGKLTLEEQAYRRNVGQGIASKAVQEMEKAIRDSATQAGPDVYRSLMEGRAATVNKYKTFELLDEVRKDMGKLDTLSQDASNLRGMPLSNLRELSKIAPQEARQLGRSWIESEVKKATAETGRFTHTQALLNDWAKLGPEAKRLLFGDPAHIKDLNDFFNLAKRMGENVNPSGTAYAGIQAGEALGLLTAPTATLPWTLGTAVTAKLLSSPVTTKLLLRGARLPVNAPAAVAAAWRAELENAVKAGEEKKE